MEVFRKAVTKMFLDTFKPKIGLLSMSKHIQLSFSSELVGSVVEWLKHRTDDQHGPGSKPTCAILLCPWERHFTALSLFGGLGMQF